MGLPITIGPQKTLSFFARRQKLRGTAAFALGILLILFRWPLPGFLIELYGILILFGDFLNTMLGFGRNVPMIGPYVARVLDWIGARRGGDLPV